jgi:hypothetical protein
MDEYLFAEQLSECHFIPEETWHLEILNTSVNTDLSTACATLLTVISKNAQ